MQLFLLTSLTMIAFAANSVLARLALEDGAIDASSYSLVRLAAGALILGLISGGQTRGKAGLDTKFILKRGGDLKSGGALLVYVVGFSFAYLALETGMGALILFACVQATMIGWGLWNGERPSLLQWVGILGAFGAFVALVSPGTNAPDASGTLLMIAAGIAWGIYSLRGRGAKNPLETTSGNFLRATLLAIPTVIVIHVLTSQFWPNYSPIHISGFGLSMAIISGAITSGLGYGLWYRCVRNLSATNAAIVQLTVPVIATAGGLIFAGEIPSLRLVICSVFILGGVVLVFMSNKPKAA